MIIQAEKQAISAKLLLIVIKGNDYLLLIQIQSGQACLDLCGGSRWHDINVWIKVVL